MKDLSNFSYMSNFNMRPNTIGGAVGSLVGGLTGAAYDPVLVNRWTGQQREIDPARRTALVSAGASAGYVGGNLLGATTGLLSKKYRLL